MFEFLNSMSFREKSLWASTAIMVYLWTWYFGRVGSAVFDGTTDRDETIGIFVSMVVILIILEVISHILVAVLNPGEADDPLDERDRQIAWRAGSHASWMIGGGVITIAMFAMFRDISAIAMVHLLILWLMAVEIASDALQIFYYRRGM